MGESSLDVVKKISIWWTWLVDEKQQSRSHDYKPEEDSKVLLSTAMLDDAGQEICCMQTLSW